MGLTVAERMLLKKAMILRRVSPVASMPLSMLVSGLEEDQELIRTKAPHLYFTDTWDDMVLWINSCVEEGLLRSTIGPGGQHFVSTRLGETFVKTLEPRLAEALDEMPMSHKGLLDLLARQ